MDVLEELGKKMAKEIAEGKREPPISFVELTTNVQPVLEKAFREYRRDLIKIIGVPFYFINVKEKINEESK